MSFQLVPYDPIDNRRAPIPVEIQTQLGAGQLADGDEVEVSGVWDGNTLDADEIVSFSADAPAETTIVPSPAESPQDKAPKRRRAGRRHSSHSSV